MSSINTANRLVSETAPVQNIKTLEAQVKDLQGQLTELKSKQPETNKDSLLLKMGKGAGKGALIGAIPAVPVAGYLLATAPSGMGGLGQGLVGIGVGLAGAVGAGIGGAVGATTSGGSKTKGALLGGATAALVGGALMTAGTNSKLGAITAVGALAFGIAGAVGGGLAAKYDK